MKSKKELAFRDEAFENEVINQVSTASEKMNELVKAFNALEMGNVQPNELETLVRKPQALYDKRLLLIEVPKGLSRVKYLQLCELPSLDMVLQLRNDLLRNPHCMSFQLFELEGETVNVIQTELTELVNTRNIYVEKDSPAFDFVSKVTTFVKSYNEINEAVGHSLLQVGIHNPLAKFFSLRELPGNSYKYRLVIERDKLVDMLRTFERNQAVRLV